MAAVSSQCVRRCMKSSRRCSFVAPRFASSGAAASKSVRARRGLHRVCIGVGAQWPKRSDMMAETGHALTW